MLDGHISDHRRIIQRIQNIRERMPQTIQEPQLMAFMERRVKARFIQGVDPEGNRWAALTPATIRIKKAAGSAFPEKPLIRTGRLFNSIQAIRTNAGFQSVTGLGFRVGVTDPEAAKYGRMHDQGLVPRTSQRKFMGVSARDAKALTDLIRREVRKLITE